MVQNMSCKIYMDHAATTEMLPQVRKAMEPYLMEEYGNASTSYEMGRRTREALEGAREQIAMLIKAKPEEIFFTSGGSESDNWVIKNVAAEKKEKGKHVITSKIEHHAVLRSCEYLEKLGYELTYLDVDAYGVIDLAQLREVLREDTTLVSVMTGNNEIGTIQRIKEIGQIAHQKNIVFHTDAVQAIGNIKIDVQKMNIDMLSMSAHKFYGPKGIGALYVKDGVNFDKIQDGGHQEKDKRAGTENVAEIVGLGKAIEMANFNIERYNAKLLKLREYCIKQLKDNVKDIKINGDLEERLPGNINVSFKGCDSSQILLELDKIGICASGGSACSSGSSLPSHVLLAIGLERSYLEGSIRLTLGEGNTKEDIDYFIANITKIIDKIKNEEQSK